jgi:hypothetical protein
MVGNGRRRGGMTGEDGLLERYTYLLCGGAHYAVLLNYGVDVLLFGNLEEGYALYVFCRHFEHAVI